ncbi:TlpA disulfide reductase family protein [Pedobacter sp.]|uniref:TlpA family protein disulfide reductase n=1 Tax=Pedobacter sp. TaxID=1411316 RepID=UPI002CE881B6|nr:TlpA disulfide reductase family protein [Pedobacter sp.]HWW38461.1 TlpA disulfide reductase family protein [Pedobacter sp.]
MKQLLILIFLLCSNLIYAQQLTVSITGSPDSGLHILYLGSGLRYFAQEKIYTLDSKGKASVINDLTSPAMIRLANNGKSSLVFLEPGKNLEIFIGKTDGKRSFKAKGANAAGIELLQKISHPFYQQKAAQYYKTDSSITAIKKAIASDIIDEIKPFDSLLRIREIDPDFYKYIRTNVDYYYASVLATVVFSQYHLTTLDKSHPRYKAKLRADYEAEWPKIYEKYPLNASAMVFPDFYYYAFDYTTWYHLMYRAQKEGRYNEAFNAENRFNKTYNGFAENFSGTMLEYLQARYIHDEAMQKEYEPQLLELYDRFLKSYPKSPYKRYLSPLIEDIHHFQHAASQSLHTDQELLANVDTFDELAARFKDKLVYVDIWATWCGPCKAEFEYNPGLHEFLKAKQIEMLYISMDKPEADQQWKQMIRYYDLRGKHIRTSDSLRQDLMNKFWDGKSYSIPRYLIVKDGKVIEANALRPADKDKLYQQIRKYL